MQIIFSEDCKKQKEKKNSIWCQGLVLKVRYSMGRKESLKCCFATLKWPDLTKTAPMVRFSPCHIYTWFPSFNTFHVNLSFLLTIKSTSDFKKEACLCGSIQSHWDTYSNAPVCDKQWWLEVGLKRVGTRAALLPPWCYCTASLHPPKCRAPSWVIRIPCNSQRCVREQVPMELAPLQVPFGSFPQKSQP